VLPKFGSRENKRERENAIERRISNTESTHTETNQNHTSRNAPAEILNQPLHHSYEIRKHFMQPAMKIERIIDERIYLHMGPKETSQPEERGTTDRTLMEVGWEVDVPPGVNLATAEKLYTMHVQRVTGAETPQEGLEESAIEGKIWSIHNQTNARRITGVLRGPEKAFRESAALKAMSPSVSTVYEIEVTGAKEAGRNEPPPHLSQQPRMRAHAYPVRCEEMGSTPNAPETFALKIIPGQSTAAIPKEARNIFIAVSRRTAVRAHQESIPSILQKKMEEAPNALRNAKELTFAGRQLIGFNSNLEHVDDKAQVEITPELLISGKARVKCGAQASITRFQITGEDKPDKPGRPTTSQNKKRFPEDEIFEMELPVNTTSREALLKFIQSAIQWVMTEINEEGQEGEVEVKKIRDSPGLTTHRRQQLQYDVLILVR